ncbi:MAG: PorP/SprF family type IX secretion system membrane protein [Saprospiraceae bacterium]|nr:PorP/SprF family type IX secretion system membrane protein [Saprospiraceae bacterium]
MRFTKTILPLFITLVSLGHLWSQEMHNTLFYMNPLHMNPAFTGAYEGTFRLGGIYRDQARTAIGSSAYSTPAIYGDAPIFMIGKRHWVGVGMLIFKDQAGIADLAVTAGQLTGAIHLALDKKSKNIFTLGVQWGKISRSTKDGKIKLRFEDEILQEFNTGSSAGIVSQDDNNLKLSGNTKSEKKYQDINIGFLFKSKLSKTADLNFGLSARHVTTPGSDYNFGGGNSNDVDLNMRFTAHAQLNTELNKKMTLTPELYFSNISPATQMQLHAWLGYWLKKADNVRVNGGLGYRVGDSAQLLLGLDYKDIKVQLGYDFTLSSLASVNKHQGGFEIAAYYIGKIYKKPKVKPVILCPHL